MSKQLFGFSFGLSTTPAALAVAEDKVVINSPSPLLWVVCHSGEYRNPAFTAQLSVEKLSFPYKLPRSGLSAFGFTPC